MLTDIEKSELCRYCHAVDYSNAFKNASFLVTGATGMIGTGIIKWLLYLNLLYDANITIYASSRNLHLLETKSYDSYVKYVEFGNEIILKDKRIDYIIHAAAPTDKNYYVKKPVETFRTIVDATENILELARICHSSMVYLSSIEVYASPNQEEPISESYVGAVDSLNLRSSYPIGKKGAEFLYYAYATEYDVDVKIARLSSVQGLFQKYDDSKIYSELLRCLAEGKDMVMKSNGLTTKSFIYTLDAVSGLFVLLLKGEKGQAYNITNPDTVMSMKDLTLHLFEIFNNKLKLVFDINDKDSIAFLATMQCIQNVEKISKLGWCCLTGLDDIYRIDLKRFEGGGQNDS